MYHGHLRSLAARSERRMLDVLHLPFGNVLKDPKRREQAADLSLRGIVAADNTGTSGERPNLNPACMRKSARSQSLIMFS